MIASDGIGSARCARDLKIGDHVRMRDGRWALVTDTGATGQPLKGTNMPHGTRTVALGLLVNMRYTECGTWSAGAQVWSRSPGEQLRYVETVITELRAAATSARFLARERRARAIEARTRTAVAP